MSISLRGRRRRIAQAAGVLALACAPVAIAQTRADERCGVVILEPEAALSDTWRVAVASLRSELARLEHDECVEGTLSVEATGAAVTLRIRLNDGREATRVVTRPSALSAIAFGLVVGMAAPARTASPPTASATLQPPVTPLATAIPVTTPAQRPTQLALDIAVGVGARVAYPTGAALPDFEARADVRADDWIIASAVRYVPVAALFDARVGGYAYSEIALALGGGRRFRFGRAALELTGMAALVLMSEDGDAPVEEGGSPSELRLDLCARLLFPWGVRVRPTLSLDGEIAPTNVATPLRVGADLPPLPTWTVGLRFGVLGDLL